MSAYTPSTHCDSDGAQKTSQEDKMKHKDKMKSFSHCQKSQPTTSGPTFQVIEDSLISQRAQEGPSILMSRLTYLAPAPLVDAHAKRHSNREKCMRQTRPSRLSPNADKERSNSSSGVNVVWWIFTRIRSHLEIHVCSRAGIPDIVHIDTERCWSHVFGSIELS